MHHIYPDLHAALFLPAFFKTPFEGFQTCVQIGQDRCRLDAVNVTLVLLVSHLAPPRACHSEQCHAVRAVFRLFGLIFRGRFEEPCDV